MTDLKTLKQLIIHIGLILNKKQRLQIVGMLFVILVGSAFEFLGVSVMLPFLQAMLNPEELMSNRIIIRTMDLLHISGSKAVLFLVGIGIVLLYIVKNCYLAFSAYLQARYSSNTRREMSALMLQSYMQRPYSFWVESQAGEIYRGVEGDTTGVYGIISSFFKLTSEILIVVLVVFFLFYTDAVLASGITIVGVLCVVLIVFGLRKSIKQSSIENREASAEKSKWLMGCINGIKDILVFCCERFFVNQYDKANEKSCKADIRYTFVSALPERVIEGVCVSGIILSVLLRIWMGVDIAEFVPKLSVFAMGAFRILPSASRMSGYISSLVYYREYAESAYENIMAARAYTATLETNVSEEDFTHSYADRIEVRNVNWRYPTGKTDVLDDISIEIKKGEAIGIIGESGSGKSTLADIILHLYNPTKGGVFMDGIDINSIPNTWKRTVAYVSQMIFLMDDSIRNNVSFGDNEVNDDKVWKALKLASLDEYVQSLPNKLDTVVGEKGIKLSGGQRQRVAIARALYNEPQILVLDEATSALDNETEEAVMEAIDALAGSITMIIIAHRITTLKNCNRVYEIRDGKAVEREMNSLFES